MQDATSLFLKVLVTNIPKLLSDLFNNSTKLSVIPVAPTSPFQMSSLNYSYQACGNFSDRSYASLRSTTGAIPISHLSLCEGQRCSVVYDVTDCRARGYYLITPLFSRLSVHFAPMMLETFLAKQ
jgi:hypothetical protein